MKKNLSALRTLSHLETATVTGGGTRFVPGGTTGVRPDGSKPDELSP